MTATALASCHNGWWHNTGMAGSAVPVRLRGSGPGWVAVWRVCVALAACWTLSGALACVAAFGFSIQPQPPPWSAGPLPASGWYPVMLLAGLSWLMFAVACPPLLVVAGLARLRSRQTGWRWPAAWAAAAASGIVVDALSIRGALASGGSSGGRHWGLLEMAAGFVAVGIAMIAVAARAASDASER